MIELRCSHETAILLGAIVPESLGHHRRLRDAGHLLVRDTETPKAMFWPWAINMADEINARSSS